MKASQSCLTLCDPMDPWNSLAQNTGVGSFSLLQGISSTQESNEPRSPALQADNLPAEPQGKPIEYIIHHSHISLTRVPHLLGLEVVVLGKHCYLALFENITPKKTYKVTRIETVIINEMLTGIYVFHVTCIKCLKQIRKVTIVRWIT